MSGLTAAEGADARVKGADSNKACMYPGTAP